MKGMLKNIALSLSIALVSLASLPSFASMPGFSLEEFELVAMIDELTSVAIIEENTDNRLHDYAERGSDILQPAFVHLAASAEASVQMNNLLVGMTDHYQGKCLLHDHVDLYSKRPG